MQINISGHHLEITDALRAYVGDKFSRLERHFDQITSVQVILSRNPRPTRRNPLSISPGPTSSPPLRQWTCTLPSTS